MEPLGNITVILLILRTARYVPARHYYTSEPNNIVIADQRHCQMSCQSPF